MTQLTKVSPTEFGLKEEQALEITKGLKQIIEEREILAANYAETIKLEITEANVPIFKELRLKIRDNRTKGIEQWHKVNKEFYLRGGQFVDAIKRKEVAENERMEENLLQCEKHFENLEKERIAKLKAAREAELLVYEVENVASLDLANMNEEVYQAFKSSCIAKYEAKKEAERKAEEERIAKEKAEAEERERVRIENERLKKEAEEREKQLAEERAKAEAERKEAERILAEEKAKAEKERREIEEKARKEREEAQRKAEEEARKLAEEKRKVEEELRKKKEQEEKERKEKEAAELKAKKEAEKLAKAPIKKQLNVWVDSFSLPEFAGENEKAEEIKAKFKSFINWAKSEIESL